MDNQSAWTDLMEQAQLLQESFDVNVSGYHADGKRQFTYIAHGFVPLQGRDEHDHIKTLIQTSRQMKLPTIVTTSILEHYVICPCMKNNTLEWNMVIGPVMSSASVDNERLQGIVEDHPPFSMQNLQAYYARMKVMPMKQLLHASVMLYYFLYRERIDILDMIQANHLTLNDKLEGRVDVEISDHLSAYQRHDYVTEKEILFLIKEGKKEQLASLLLPETKLHGVGTLSKRSSLRNHKNLSIAGIALATRAAVEGGLHPEVAYTMSDLYIQQIEELREVSEVKRLLNHVMLEFASRVHANQEGRVSNTIAACKNYIFTHLYDRITLDEVAASVHLHANYLSRIFKEETGMTFRAYVQDKRIEEAKKLLELSDYPISTIYARLCFNDQSYFTKIFKQKTGVTPKDYRDGLRA